MPVARSPVPFLPVNPLDATIPLPTSQADQDWHRQRFHKCGPVSVARGENECSLAPYGQLRAFAPRNLFEPKTHVVLGFTRFSFELPVINEPHSYVLVRRHMLNGEAEQQAVTWCDANHGRDVLLVITMGDGGRSWSALTALASALRRNPDLLGQGAWAPYDLMKKC